jgi:hypothetical protein
MARGSRPHPDLLEGAGRRPRRARGSKHGLERRVGSTAGRGGVPEVELMREIERYNEVDCRVMWEVISHLRSHH